MRRFRSKKTMVGLLLAAFHMDADIKEEFAAIRAEIRSVETILHQEIREEGVSTRRHFDVVAESLRDDIRIIAEGLIALDAKVQTMRE